MTPLTCSPTQTVSNSTSAPRAHHSERSSRPTAYGISSSPSAWYWYTGAAGAVPPSLLWPSRARQSGWASGSRVVRSEIRLKE